MSEVANVDGMRSVTVAVIGAGQAGLSAGYHLARSGFLSALDRDLGDGAATFLMFDAHGGPGGAWQDRWESLTVGSLNAIFDLPGMSKPRMDATESSRTAVPRYFAEFEARYATPVLRPVTVHRVTRRADLDGFRLETSAGVWNAQLLINATGTWTNPVWPDVPGATSFAGLQLHTHDYETFEAFAGMRTAVVGGGISALQHLEEISRVTDTLWYTRRPVEWRTSEFNLEAGRDVIRNVTADVEAGRPTGSVVSYTGLPCTEYARVAHERGALDRRPMFASIEPFGVRENDGSFTSVDAILWATGFKGALAHLDPLNLRNDLGGITMRGTRVADEPGLHLIGFGPSQSTVGANRAGRDAVRDIERQLSSR